MQIDIPTKEGKHLHGVLQKERIDKPLVVVCHGYNSSSKHPALVAIVAGLNQKGHTTFTFDFSEGSELDLEQQVRDIRTITEYFISYDEFIVLAGSFGALTAAMAVRKTPKISGLTTVNGFFGSKELGSKFQRPYKIFKLLTYISPHHKKIWQAYKTGFQPQDISIPVLVIHSKTDEIVSFKQSEEFYSKVKGPKELKLLDAADHHLTSDSVVMTIVSLIDTWLRNLMLPSLK